MTTGDSVLHSASATGFSGLVWFAQQHPRLSHGVFSREGTVGTFRDVPSPFLPLPWGLRPVIPGTNSSAQLKEILGTQESQLSARMQMEAEAFLGQHPAPGEELALMQSSLEMRPCCTCQQL